MQAIAIATANATASGNSSALAQAAAQATSQDARETQLDHCDVGRARRHFPATIGVGLAAPVGRAR